MKFRRFLVPAVAACLIGLTAQVHAAQSEASQGVQVAQVFYSFVCRWTQNPAYYCMMSVAGPVGAACYCPGFPNGFIATN